MLVHSHVDVRLGHFIKSLLHAVKFTLSHYFKLHTCSFTQANLVSAVDILIFLVCCHFVCLFLADRANGHAYAAMLRLSVFCLYRM